MPFLPSRLLASVLLAGCLAAPVAAQTVAGRVLEAETGQPVPAAVVVLETENGARVGATLADAAGAYAIRAPAPGRYQLRAERVGYAAAAPVAVELAAGERAEVVLRADSRRVMLPPLVGTARSRACERRVSEGAETAQLWEEAERALRAASLAEEEGRYRFRTRLARTTTALDGRPLRTPVRWEVESTGTPFASASAEALERDGYAVVDGDSLVLHGIGPAAVLSDAFLEAHCFGVRAGAGSERDLVGLEFVPLEGRTGPDVRGVLWVERATSELRRVDFSYTNLRIGGPRHELGGRLELRRLPGGGWVLWRWSIRAPMLHPSRTPLSMETLRQYRIWGYQLTSGEVLEVTDARTGEVVAREAP